MAASLWVLSLFFWIISALVSVLMGHPSVNGLAGRVDPQPPGLWGFRPGRPRKLDSAQRLWSETTARALNAEGWREKDVQAIPRECVKPAEPVAGGRAIIRKPCPWIRKPKPVKFRRLRERSRVAVPFLSGLG